MSGLVLDMSQAAINRTAMYTISHDTRAALGHSVASLQYFGEPFGAVPSREALTRTRDRRLGRVLGDPEAAARSMRRRGGRLASVPRLFLDPLYILFDELTPDDVVMVLDLSTVTTPEWHQPVVSRAYSHAFDRLSQVRPRVLAISANTALTLRVNYGYPQALMDVVPLYVPRHLAGDGPPIPAGSGDAAPYVLFVGSLEARKNLIGAVRSFALSGLGERGYQLVVVGGQGHGAQAIRAAAAGVRGVRFEGYLADAEVNALYRGASAFVYPSYLEGFGVPLLEAMHFGVPATASVTGACPEVGGDLIEYFEPDDHAGFAGALVRLVAMTAAERAAYAAAARARIDRLFTFDRYVAALTGALAKAGLVGREETAAC